MSVRWVSEAEWNELKGKQVPQKSSTKITLFLDIVPGNKCWLCYNPESGLLIEAQTPKEAQENFMKCVSEGKMREKAVAMNAATPAPVQAAPVPQDVEPVDEDEPAAPTDNALEPAPVQAAPIEHKSGRKHKSRQ